MAGEKLFENKIKRFFHSIGVYPAGFPKDKMQIPPIGWYFKMWGGGFQKSGIPDIIACVNGIFTAVEVKASNGRPSELQKLNVKRINEAEGIAIILYPEGFDDFKKIMGGVINCNTHTVALNVLKNALSSSKCVILTG